MIPLLRILNRIARQERRALLQGLALSALVLGMGVALLGISGWFITATALAGLAGIGILFNVFMPSAAIRLLALGRTAARYGERVQTHDATLRALSRLRIDLLRGLMTRPQRRLERIRAAAMINRITADIDALDGALLRLILPALAGWGVIALTTLVLWLLVDPRLALAVGLCHLVLPTVIFGLGQRLARRPARQTEAALQAGRSRLIDLIAGRDDLTVYGQLQRSADHCRDAFRRHALHLRRLDRLERRMGGALDLSTGLAVALAIGIGGHLVTQGTLDPARAAIAIFAALALGEATAPVRRALSEVGRMTQAARRIWPDLPAPPVVSSAPLPTGTLHLQGVTYRIPGSGRDVIAPVDLTLAPGDCVALTGPSGSGKSTLLLLAAGALQPTTGTITLGGRPLTDWSADALTGPITLVPQRHALIGGSVADNLRLAAPGVGDAALWHALEITCLAQTLRDRDGLDTRLGFRGAGLSGGEARRLVLARAVLRRPQILLLDEPTEGLEDALADTVLHNIRRALPDVAILIAAHRAADRNVAERSVALKPPV
ncbi:thiol reductant ABC exporter subunit CydC [Pseudooceanicola onchidii]|uniref:thiol reductant ABC exporter subunit CydC n=1 Tax=Pseudooceanicola onchidii TaxID=2562279 RepID=UPI0010AA452E|nr:thiol reductant ABC exporter subunit CydC [Pseudooceanicola onchidii]